MEDRFDSYRGNYEAVANSHAPDRAINLMTNGVVIRNRTNNNASSENNSDLDYSELNIDIDNSARHIEMRGQSIEQIGQRRLPQEDDEEYEDFDEDERFVRRGSMSAEQEKERRASIKAIMMDATIAPVEKRKSIQAMMDGRVSNKERRTSLTDVDIALASNGGNPTSIIDVSIAMEQSRPQCTHYKRKCTIISPCCGAAFGCRICHDECPFLPPPKTGIQSQLQSISNHKHVKKGRSRSLPGCMADMPKPEQHEINRFEIKEIICRECYTRQSSKANKCIKCHTKFGEYHCEICNLWMSAEEQPYHCIECGFCRVGGKDNFKHCDACGMCVDFILYDNHNCNSGKYMSNCPVCQEDLFSSRSATHEMPCGHTIHWHCYLEFSKHDSRCPVCKKTSENMSQAWSALALSIAVQPVPVELAKVVDILCNDCEHLDQNLRWHYLGVQCRMCGSFNTSIEKVTLKGEQAALFADHMDNFRTQMSSRENAESVNIASVGEITLSRSASSVSSRSMHSMNGIQSHRSSVTESSENHANNTSHLRRININSDDEIYGDRNSGNID